MSAKDEKQMNAIAEAVAAGATLPAAFRRAGVSRIAGQALWARICARLGVPVAAGCEMSGVGGPLVAASNMSSVEETLDRIDGPVGDVLIDDERAAIARRIGNIAAACQREAVEGMVPLAIVEMRLMTLSDDVRAGIHGGAR